METVLVKIRWLILQDWKIFLVKLTKEWFWCLPGWTLEKWESLEECLYREIFEELWVQSIIWKQVYQQHFIRETWTHTFDFWYQILNPNDFKNINIEKASHWFEIAEAGFFDINNLDDLDFEVKPNWIKSIVESIWI